MNNMNNLKDYNSINHSSMILFLILQIAGIICAVISIIKNISIKKQNR